MFANRIIQNLLGVGVFFILGMLSVPFAANAALPAGFEVQTVVGGLNLPTTLAFSPEGRIFIAEKNGTVRIFKDGALLPTSFIQLENVNDFADHGLLGLALDPNFGENGYVYLLYTHENSPANYQGPKTGRIVRVTAHGDIADLSSITILAGSVAGTPQQPSCDDYPVTADCIPTDSPSHSVGGLRFGPDGKLYATLGDGAHFDYMDPRAMRALNIDSLAGKLIRINTDGTAPADNPFYNGDPQANRSKVWAYGLRNAYRFTFRPANGMPYLGDVGWYTWEEISLGRAGANLGWPCREGFEPAPAYNCTTPGYTDPLYAYSHEPTGTGAVTMGAFYIDTGYPGEYQGNLFFGDFSQNFIKRLVVDENDNLLAVVPFMDDAGGPVDIQAGPEGNIYYISIYSGEVRTITYTLGNRQPIAAATATPGSGLAPLDVQFTSIGSYDPDGDPLSYEWDFGDGSATTTEANPRYVYAANGDYTAQLTVRDGRGGMASRNLRVVAGNEAPTAVITSPAEGSSYEPGSSIIVTGSGSDPETGPIPASNMRWRIILHHDTHIHVLEERTGESITFPAPDHNATDVHLEIELTVTDDINLAHTDRIELFLDLPVRADTYRAEYFGNPGLTGDPAILRYDPVINFQWGGGGPGSPLSNDLYSARFTGDFSFAEGEHTFFLSGDDGVRLYLDGALLVDKWIDQPATEYTATFPITSGLHRVTVEYYERYGNALLTLRWERVSPAGGTGVEPHLAGIHLSPTSPIAGEAIVITADITNMGTAEPILVDIEAYKDSVKVVQMFYDNETIATGAVRNFTLSWMPQSAGNYRIAVGLMRPGWGGVYEWTNDALALTVGDGAPSPPPQAFSPRHLATTISSRPSLTGEPLAITTTVKNEGGEGTMLVDIEVYKSSTKVAQLFFDNVAFASGETKSFTFNWTPPSAGNYGVAIGLFQPGWNGLYEWVGESVRTTVSDTPPGSSGAVAIYGDALDPTWENWSWDTAVVLSSSDAAYEGGASMKVTFNTPWAGAYFHIDSLDTTGRSSLAFAVHGGQTGNQQLQIVMFDSATNALIPVNLTPYLPSTGIPATAWATVTVPLSALQTQSKVITGFAVQGAAGNTEAPFYLDSIRIN